MDVTTRAAPAPAPEPTPPGPHASPPSASWVDWLMVGLALFSLTMLLVEQTFIEWFLAHPTLYRAVILTDLAICAVFAIEFIARIRRVDDRWAYARSHWYEIVGMIPVSHPAFRAFRLFRILRLGVIGGRFVRATNETFGERAFEITVSRFKDILVEVIGDALVLRSLDLIEPHLCGARFSESIASAMDTRRYAIHGLVRQNLRRLPGTRAIGRFRWARDAVDDLEDTVVEAVIDTLRSDELNAVVQEATRVVLDELRREIQQDREPGGDGGAQSLPTAPPLALPPPATSATGAARG